MTVLMATHDLDLVRRNPTLRVIELSAGRVVFDSAAAEPEEVG
jgi:ABC-type phosphate/phosphonate transport system ATPase subunit